MRRLKIFKIYLIFWIFVFYLGYSSFDTMSTYFMATLSFNSAIAVILAIGTIIVLTASFNVTMLAGTFGVMQWKKGDELIYYLKGIEKIMPTSIANMFKNRAEKGVLYFTQHESEELLDWLNEKFANQKIYLNFFISTSLMIGLFGTFVGLLTSIDKMGGIILSLGGDINLGEVIASFAGPLGGMAIGFGSSLFGVAVAIILGIQGYILSRTQEVFLVDVENWMKGQILESQTSDVLERVSQKSSEVALPSIQHSGDSGSGAIGSGMLDLFIENMGALTSKMEESIKANEVVFTMLTESTDSNTDIVKSQHSIFEAMSNGLKDLNVSQFNNANMMEESLQNISNASMVQSKNMKEMLELQKESSLLLAELVKTLNKKLGDK